MRKRKIVDFTICYKLILPLHWWHSKPVKGRLHGFRPESIVSIWTRITFTFDVSTRFGGSSTPYSSRIRKGCALPTGSLRVRGQDLAVGTLGLRWKPRTCSYCCCSESPRMCQNTECAKTIIMFMSCSDHCLEAEEETLKNTVFIIFFFTLLQF